MCAGSEAIVTESFKLVFNHVVYYENSYTHYFKTFPVFGGYIISQLHEGFQLLLQSCAFRDETRIDFEAIDFTDLLNLIRRRKLQVFRLPGYIKDIENKKRKSIDTVKYDDEDEKYAVGQKGMENKRGGDEDTRSNKSK